jgi:hypothetical protein
VTISASYTTPGDTITPTAGFCELEGETNVSNKTFTQHF